jgi:hypothetical protein
MVAVSVFVVLFALVFPSFPLHKTTTFNFLPFGDPGAVFQRKPQQL